MIIEDGGGKNGHARTTASQQLTTFSISESELVAATGAGKAFNINTGTIALTGTGTSAILYFKNDESPVSGESDYVVTAIAVGVGTRSATITDAAVITVLRNPAAGTIIDNATNVDMKSNANFGSSNTLGATTLAYKGATGYTLTGGTEHALLYMTDGRLFADLDIVIPRGAAIGITIDLNTSGGANVYCALIGYRKDGGNKV
jgi:hypothetical protein